MTNPPFKYSIGQRVRIKSYNQYGLVISRAYYDDASGYSCSYIIDREPIGNLRECDVSESDLTPADEDKGV